MEFGLSETLPIYSGGLGVLAGDFLRSAHALRVPLVGIGLLWAEGYTRQSIGADGRPEDHPMVLDRSPLQKLEPIVRVQVAGREVPLALYRLDAFDNAPLYLLEPIEERDRHLTRRLYGGDDDLRVQQEILLGVGGVRALAALGIEVDVHHFNEGHAVFAGLELMRLERARGLGFEQAWAAVRPRIVFTTHTPVDAGNERHPVERLEVLGATVGFSHEEVLRIGGSPFNMTAAGLRLSHRANAVAQLHGETARAMWHHVEDGAHIVAITNGVDHRVWQDPRLAGPLDDHQLESGRANVREELFAEVERRVGVTLDPHALTIGFARRATGYKRATLFFQDVERAEALLDKGGVQLVYAGKAHPKDFGGQTLIAELVRLAKVHPGKVVFLPDYDLRLGRILTRGCDIWLNTPRRPLEACGTSGMKAAMNGVLHVSILDGWWAEACEHGKNGWAIGGAHVYDTDDDGDDQDAEALYALLENEILPTFHKHRAKWRALMRASMKMAVEKFSADRMVREYYDRLYPREVQVHAHPAPLRLVG